MDKVESCAICAWRQSCQKKFSLSGKLMHCPEFVRDLTIKEEKEDENISSDKVKPKKPEEDKE